MNLSDWLAALHHATAAAPPEGFATRDLATIMNISEAAARSLLRKWHRLGMIEYAGCRAELRMDGRAASIPIYRPTKGVLDAAQSSEEGRQEVAAQEGFTDRAQAEAYVRTSAARPKRTRRGPDRPVGE